jgi:hypothetical protein
VRRAAVVSGAKACISARLEIGALHDIRLDDASDRDGETEVVQCEECGNDDYEMHLWGGSEWMSKVACWQT